MNNPLERIHRPRPKMDTQEEKAVAIGYEALTTLEKKLIFAEIEQLLVETVIHNRVSYLQDRVIPETIPVKDDVKRLEAELVAWLGDPNRDPYVHVEVPGK
ncbi:MAG: hypothetical protein QM757_26815 [Paludibaculum sp.]